MNLGLDYLTNNYYMNQINQQKKTVEQDSSIGFNSILSTKAVDSTTKAQMSFEEMLKSKYSGVYYNVMDTSQIDGALWGRNDYPWNAYFSEPADKSVLNWTPSGAEPDMQSPAVHAKMNSMLGKIAVVIPPELEEKMKNNPELVQKVMERVDNFLLTNSTPGENEGFLMTFDENGEINHACVVGELKITVSSSEFVEERKAREAKHAEYERIAEENAVKRKLLEQENLEKRYRRTATEGDILKYEKNFLLLKSGGGTN